MPIEKIVRRLLWQLQRDAFYHLFKEYYSIDGELITLILICLRVSRDLIDIHKKCNKGYRFKFKPSKQGEYCRHNRREENN